MYIRIPLLKLCYFTHMLNDLGALIQICLGQLRDSSTCLCQRLLAELGTLPRSVQMGICIHGDMVMGVGCVKAAILLVGLDP